MGNCDAFEPFQQSTVYAVAAQSCGARVRWLDCGHGRALAVERGRLRVIMRAVVPGDDRQRRRVLRGLARWAGVTVITPEVPVAGWGLMPLVTPIHHAIWPLGPDLRAGMAGKWRNGLVAAERAGLRVEPGFLKTLEDLIAAETQQRRQRRYLALPVGFSRAIPMDALRIWHWHDQDRLAAAMAFVRHGSSATYHLGWASTAARTSGVHGLMLTHAAETLHAEGVRWLDLGSVDTEANPGLARFKLGTGAVLRRLGATCLVLP